MFSESLYDILYSENIGGGFINLQNYIEDSLSLTTRGILIEVDPRVCIDIYLGTHPDQSQAALAKEVFSITPASFSKALSQNKDYLREDWRDKIRELLRDTDITDYEIKVGRIIALKKRIDLQDRRAAIRTWAAKYLREMGIASAVNEIYAEELSDYRTLVFHDDNSQHFFAFYIPDEGIRWENELDYTVATSSDILYQVKQHLREYTEKMVLDPFLRKPLSKRNLSFFSCIRQRTWDRLQINKATIDLPDKIEDMVSQNAAPHFAVQVTDDFAGVIETRFNNYL